MAEAVAERALRTIKPCVRPAPEAHASPRSQDKALRSLIASLDASRIWPASRLFLCSAPQRARFSVPAQASTAARAQPRSRPARMRRPRGLGLEVGEHGRNDGCATGHHLHANVDLRTGSWFFSRSAKAAATWRSKLATLSPDRGLPDWGRIAGARVHRASSRRDIGGEPTFCGRRADLRGYLP